jgi:hypothetical protein
VTEVSRNELLRGCLKINHEMLISLLSAQNSNIGFTEEMDHVLQNMTFTPI